MIGSEVHIDIFDDRLEIYSQGGMVDESSLEGRDFRSISSQRRNPVLADIFSRLNLKERRGSGFKKILEDYDFQENVTEDLMPKFSTEYKDFMLTLYNLNYVAKQRGTQDVAQGVAQETSSKYEKQILELVKNNDKVTREEIAQKIGVSKKTIEREIKIIKKYAAGKMVYFPKNEEEKSKWGMLSGQKLYYRKRNQMICNEFLYGVSVVQLAEKYHLSVETIKKIVYSKKNQERLSFCPDVESAMEYEKEAGGSNASHYCRI